MADESSIITSEQLAALLAGKSSGQSLSFAIFLRDYVIEGCVASINPGNNKMVDVTDAIITLGDGIYAVKGKSFRVSIPSENYFIDFVPNRGYVMGIEHPTTDYLPLWQVITKSDGTINNVQDDRGTVGGVQFNESIVGIIVNDVVVDAAHIQNNAVITAKIQDGAVTNPKIAALAVDNGKIADSSITASKIGIGAVTTVKLLDGNVTEAKIADGAVTNSKLGDKAITTDKIMDGTIQLGNMGINSVGTIQLVPGSVDVDRIADGAVSITKMANGSVGPNQIQNNSIATGRIIDGAITGIKIATDAISTLKIVDGAVTTAKLADMSVTNEKIADNTISGLKLQPSTITADKLSLNSIPESALLGPIYENKLALDYATGGLSQRIEELEGNSEDFEVISARGAYPTLADRLDHLDNFDYHIQNFTATEGQVTFTLSGSYAMGQDRVKVFIEGVPQDEGVDFEELSSTQIQIIGGVPEGGWVRVEWWQGAIAAKVKHGQSHSKHGSDPLPIDAIEGAPNCIQVGYSGGQIVPMITGEVVPWSNYGLLSSPTFDESTSVLTFPTEGDFASVSFAQAGPISAGAGTSDVYFPVVMSLVPLKVHTSAPTAEDISFSLIFIP